ncbi:MAG: BrnT family toxin [Anaerolineae bacterium]|nr:BrnT family toxin [Anaerolineae bacterium]
MQYTWDEAKRESNLRKHRLDFADAEIVFDGLTVTFEDDRFDYREQRFITIGILADEFVVIAHTEEQDSTRIISMRKATKHEEFIFFNTFGD